MTTLAALVGVEKSFGSWTVFRDLDFEVVDGARVGIVGPNGAGKSTLLRILADLEPPSAGEVVRRRGLVAAYLDQNPDGDERTAEATVMAARPDVAELDAQLRAVEAELARPEVIADLARMGRVLERQQGLLDRWVQIGGPGLAGEVRSQLLSLDIPEEDLALPTSLLSGGQRKLVALAACLITQPDLLLLDEPETHLDADRRGQLEDLIAGFPGGVVAVSHDRYLLDETVDHIAELDNGKITMWPGNYSAFAVAKEIALHRQQQLYVTQQKEIARLEEAIARFKLWASIVVDERHIKQARNKQRQIDRMDKVDRPVFERRKIALEMRAAQRGGQKIVELRDVTVAFDDDPVLLDVDLTITRGERVGIIGANGAGKSVLGKVLEGQMAHLGSALDGTFCGVRLPGTGSRDRAAPPHADRVRPQREADVRGGRGLAARPVPVPLRADASTRRHVVGRGANTLTTLPVDAGRRELPAARRAHEPPRHREHGGPGVGPGTVRRDGHRHLARSVLARPDPDRIVEVRDGLVSSHVGGYDDWAAARVG